MPAIDEELESELADYFARNGGNVPGHSSKWWENA
jgi:hypothetical protein